MIRPPVRRLDFGNLRRALPVSRSTQREYRQNNKFCRQDSFHHGFFCLFTSGEFGLFVLLSAEFDGCFKSGSLSAELVAPPLTFSGKSGTLSADVEEPEPTLKAFSSRLNSAKARSALSFYLSRE